MKIKKTIISCLLMMGLLSAAAQEQQVKTEYVFNPHWYIQIQPLGGQYTLGEASFNDLVSYNVQLGAGYQFNSVAGIRLSVNAWQSKAAWEMDGMTKTWKWKYVSPMVDVTANLSNLFCGFNPNRVFNFSVFGGIGANIAWDNDEAASVKAQIGNYYSLLKTDQNLLYLWDGTKTRFAGRAGVMADFRVSKAVSVGIELQATTLNDHYNSKSADNSDWYFNALAGVKINLGKTHTTRTITPPAPQERIIERVVEKVVEKPVPAPVAEKKVQDPLRRDIFFKINTSKIISAEMQKVEDIANYLKKYPEAKVEVTGYADKDTGTSKINSTLASKRAKSVVDALTNNYGISSSRIISSSKGDKVQPFNTPNQNRVSICIAQ